MITLHNVDADTRNAYDLIDTSNDWELGENIRYIEMHSPQFENGYLIHFTIHYTDGSSIYIQTI